MRFETPEQAVRAYASAVERSSAISRSVIAHGREYDAQCSKRSCQRARRRANQSWRRRRALQELSGAETLETPPHDWVQWVEHDRNPEDPKRRISKVVYRCAYCNGPRGFADAYILGGLGTSGRKGRPPGPMIRAGDLGPLSQEIEALQGEVGYEQAAVYVLHCWAGGETYSETAHIATERSIGDRHWTRDQVAKAVKQARASLRRRLEIRGILHPRGHRLPWHNAVGVRQ